MIKRLFNKTFNIHEGETRIVFLMQFYIFLIITVLLLVKPTVTSLFLTNLGAEQLPYGYLLVAFFAIITSIFYNPLVKKYSIKVIAMFTIIIFSIFFLTLSFVVYHNIYENWILYFYYLSISLFGILVTSQFWVIANLVFDLREAKRLFGIIGAGAIAGGIFGGYLTTFLANYFGNSIVILIASILLLLCLPLILTIWKLRVNQLDKFIKKDRKDKNESILGSSLGLILKSKHLLNLALIVGISVLVAKLIDYQFNVFAHKKFKNPNDLASFFGFWFSSFNILALLIQLFFTNKLLARFGVSKNLMFLPLSLLIGSFLFFIFPELWVLILIKGIDGSFKQSINKAAFELSILPISYDTKKQAKPFIDVVVDSVATGLAGFLLLFIIKKLNVETTYITALTIFFLIIWFVLIYRLRKTYFDTFRTNIKGLITENKQENEKTVNKPFSMIDCLKSGKEKEIINLLNLLDFRNASIYQNQIINLIDHTSNKVKLSAIKSIYHIKNDLVLSKLNELIKTNKDDEVVYEAMEYLLMHSSGKSDVIFINYLDNKRDYVKNAALLCLARATRYNVLLGKKYELCKRIKSQIDEFTQFEDMQRDQEIGALLLTIGYSGKEEFYTFIDKYLKSKNEILKKNAIKAAGLTRYEPYILELVKLIGNESYKDEVIDALKKFGNSIVQYLYNLDNEELIEDKSRGYIPMVIEVFKTKKSIVLLLHLLKSKDVLVRLSAAQSLKNIKNSNYKLQISDKRLSENIFNECLYFKNTLTAILSVDNANQKTVQSKKYDQNNANELNKLRTSLIKNLQEQLDLSLETIFSLLSEKYIDSDMDVAFKGIKNNTEESRINAVEFLSNMLESDLKNELLPLLEYHFLSDGNVNFDIEHITENKCLLKLIKERGIITKILVLKIFDLKQYPVPKTLMKTLLQHKNTKIRNLAKKINNN